MLKIEILSTELTHRVITTKGNRQVNVYEQKAYVTLNGEPYPKEIKISLWPDRSTGEEPQPHPVGNYTLDPSSFSVGRYANLECRPKLKSLDPAKPKAA